MNNLRFEVGVATLFALPFAASIHRADEWGAPMLVVYIGPLALMFTWGPRS